MIDLIPNLSTSIAETSEVNLVSLNYRITPQNYNRRHNSTLSAKNPRRVLLVLTPLIFTFPLLTLHSLYYRITSQNYNIPHNTLSAKNPHRVLLVLTPFCFFVHLPSGLPPLLTKHCNESYMRNEISALIIGIVHFTKWRIFTLEYQR